MRQHSSVTSLMICFSLMVSLCVGTPTRNKASAQSRIPPEQITKLSSDLLQQSYVSGVGDRRAKVILQLRERPSRQLIDLLIRSGVEVSSNYENFNSKALDLPVGIIAEMASFQEVLYISPDRSLQLLGHIENTTGAMAARLLQGCSGLDGKEIGIAIIDSGIYNDHHSFSGRIAANVDFTGENNLKEDPYGHGTHVAAMAAASRHVANGAYSGVAINSKIINLRVLNSQGIGTSSSLLNALDWVMNNKARYNIRVVNMSLGTMAVDSYVNDPLCLAVRRLVDAGIVVVAAAGNNGKDGAGNKLYGAVHSPGIEPSAITVGAVNTYGTDGRSDDSVATYSSRGPTRGAWIDAAGAKHYDNLIKPDLVAPGNRLIGAESEDNSLVATNPALDAQISDDEHHEEMALSGTSMASPIVAGAVALMIQANPKLTPNLVKAILMYTAQPLAGFNMFEQGAGELNIEGAIRLAKLVRTDLTNATPAGAPLLISAVPPIPQSMIAGQPAGWSQGILTNYTYVTGVDLITRYQKVYGTGMLISEATPVVNGLLNVNTLMVSGGVQIGDGVLTSTGMLIS
ncbi:MAG TPA: S8 family peptidase, partial [Blastocatellia bacterium]